MNSDNFKPNTDIIIGGYSTENLSNDNIFFSNKNKKKPKLTFIIHDIVMVNESEILKIKLKNSFICRIMKHVDSVSSQPVLIFDMVNEEKKTIEFKANKYFYNGVGLGLFLFEYDQITQWEISVMDLICRSFIFGNKQTFLETIEKFNIKTSKTAEIYIKTELE